MTILLLPRQRPSRQRRAPAAVAAGRPDPARRTVGQLTAAVSSSLALCTRTAIDPDEWFPVARGPERARAEAAAALGLCAVCPMRPECLELSMRIWDTGGQHGIWGGFVEADRRVALTRWLAGVPVTALVRTPAADLRRGRRDSRSASADPEPHVRRRSTSTIRSCDVPPHPSGAA